MSYKEVLAFEGFKLYHPTKPWSQTAASGALVPLMGTPHMVRRFCRSTLECLDSKQVERLVVHIQATFKEKWPEALRIKYGISDPDPENIELPAGLILSVCDYWLEDQSQEAHWAVLAFVLLEAAAGHWRVPTLPKQIYEERLRRNQTGDVLAHDAFENSEEVEAVSRLGRLTHLGSSIAFIPQDERVYFSITDEPTMRLHNVLHLTSEAWSCVTLLQGQIDARVAANEIIRNHQRKAAKGRAEQIQEQGEETRKRVLKAREKMRAQGYPPERNIASTLAQRADMPSEGRIRRIFREEDQK